MADKCPNCGKTVYFAEEVRALGKAWHKRCLKCAQCNVALDAAKINDRQGKVYCKNCYNSVAGLKGFGYGTASESSVSGGATGKVTYANAPIDEESALAKGFTDGFQPAEVNPGGQRPFQVAEKHNDPVTLLPVPRIHTHQEPQPPLDAGFNPPVNPSVSQGSDGGGYSLKNDGDWAYFDVNLVYKGAGHGGAALKKKNFCLQMNAVSLFGELSVRMLEMPALVWSLKQILCFNTKDHKPMQLKKLKAIMVWMLHRKSAQLHTKDLLKCLQMGLI